MSALIKATSVFGGLALTASAAAYTFKTPAQDFSQVALNAAEHGDRAVSAKTPKKLPSNFFQVTVGGYKFSNA